MRVPYGWMADYCDPGLEPRDLAEQMAMTGTEVERVVTLGPESADGFVIGKAVSVEKHPDADRLNVCQVDVGEGEVRTIVCGAPNVAAGQTVVVALPGAVMPGGMKIKQAKLRGVESNGMICSERELELGEDHDGILVLGDGPAPGTPAAELLPLAEPVLDLEVTPNRTDCFGIYGVAREAHAISGAELAPAPWDGGPIGPGLSSEAGDVERLDDPVGEESTADRIRIIVQDEDLCPRFTARGYTDVKVGPSPLWLKARLIAAGMRPISNVVDITNYVMWLTGQPMHAYDLDLVPEGELVVRRAESGEKVAALDGNEYELSDQMVAVADRNGLAGIGGMMGGSVSEVSETTTTVLMEAANWNGPNLLKTSRDLGLRSEASSRFEKQLHPALTLRAQAVAARLMIEICGATPMTGLVDVAAPAPASEPIRLRAGRVERILGLAIETDRQAEALEMLGFGVERDGEDLVVTVPPDRHYDVTREIDLVEEVGRISDLDRNLPATLPSGAGRPGGLSRQQSLQRRAEDSLRESGFDEMVGWSFTDPAEVERLRLDAADPRSHPVKLANPLSEDQSVMRTILLGSVLGAAQRNLSRGADRVALFESGRVYLPAGEFGPGPLGGDFPGNTRPPSNEPQHLCAVAVGSIDPSSWRGEAGVSDFFALKGVLEHLAGGLGTAVTVERLADGPVQPFLHPGKSGSVLVEGQAIGWIGEVHPLVAAEYDLDGAVAFEIALADLLAASPVGEEAYVDFTPFPPVDRDLAVLVAEEVSAATVVAAVEGSGGELLTGVSVFDVYSGEGVGEGEKSLALRLRFRAPDRTLSDEEIDPLVSGIVESLAGIGGKLRG
ncbi:MAG: phenylalanine--tRNA ligase subunit beta [Solirubrobacterales bacterium]|nr:phenylalanine--tRNA ligase subunit beta [Solirubrobacterales bacterium]OJU95174.1 MAG: phenylalanine--tRNA ligase subunit beta [Solirubrobacterales bacterium 67-14]